MMPQHKTLREAGHLSTLIFIDFLSPCYSYRGDKFLRGADMTLQVPPSPVATGYATGAGRQLLGNI